MKIILLKNVPKVGQRYDIKNVSDGHALNFLIPQGLAEVATTNALKRLETLRASDEGSKKARNEMAAKHLKDLEGKVVVFKGPANDKGSLFAGIHAEQLADLIKTQTSLEVSPEHIMLPKPLKEVGEHVVQVKVGDASAAVTIKVEAQ